MRIAICANEPSADCLGAGLIRELRLRFPAARFEGIGGPLMIAEGFTSHFPQERLAVMGLVEVLRHLPELLGIRRAIVARYLAEPPDCFIGIDAPDFNLAVETRLRRAGIPTVHYVCPTVWAWREGRVRILRAAADLVLCIFPFEPAFLARHGVAGRFVGHSMADEIAIDSDRPAARHRARSALSLGSGAPLLALLPGSRMGEVRTLTDLYLHTAVLLQGRHRELRVVCPAATPRVRAFIEARIAAIAPDLPITLLDGHARAALRAADLALVASGTATLEAFLLGTPMVVAYRLNPVTYWIVKTFRLVRTRFVSMPNLLTEGPLVPELIQDAATPEALAEALGGWLGEPERRAEFEQAAAATHRLMRREASRQAAEAVAGLLGTGAT